MSSKDTRREAYQNLAFCAFVYAVAFVLYFGAKDLPPPRFEPLGSAALPNAIAVILTVLASFILVPALLTLHRARKAEADSNEGVGLLGEYAVWRGLAIFAVLVTYVAALDFFRSGFVITTTIVVTVISGIFVGLRPKSLILHAIGGFCLAMILMLVFTKILYVDLT